MNHRSPPHPDPAPPIAPRTPTRESLARLTPHQPLEVPGPGELRTPRLTLRPLRESDRAAFLEAVRESREHLDRFSALHLPEESDNELFDRQRTLTEEGERTGRACRRAAFDRTGAMVGACNLNAIRRGLTWEADCNWWIAQPHTRRGYAAEALAALLRHALDEIPDGLGLHRVRAAIQPDNAASRALAIQIGFSPLGPEQTYLHAGGHWDLHEVFAATPESVAAARAAG